MDTVPIRVRSEIMRRVGSTDTTPEMKVRRMIHAMGFPGTGCTIRGFLAGPISFSLREAKSSSFTGASGTAIAARLQSFPLPMSNTGAASVTEMQPGIAELSGRFRGADGRR